MWLVIIAFLIILTLILMFLFLRFNINKIILRKILHIVVCLICILNNKIYYEEISILFIPVIFFFINIVIKKYNIFSFMMRENEHNGALHLSIIILLTTILHCINLLNIEYVNYFYIVLAFGDGLSGLTPVIFKNRLTLKNNKSINGFILFFIFSFLSLFIYNKFTLSLEVGCIFLVCLSSAIIELITNNGYDNLFIFVNVCFLLTFM